MDARLGRVVAAIRERGMTIFSSRSIAISSTPAGSVEEIMSPAATNIDTSPVMSFVAVNPFISSSRRDEVADIEEIYNLTPSAGQLDRSSDPIVGSKHGCLVEILNSTINFYNGKDIFCLSQFADCIRSSERSYADELAVGLSFSSIWKCSFFIIIKGRCYAITLRYSHLPWESTLLLIFEWIILQTSSSSLLLIINFFFSNICSVQMNLIDSGLCCLAVVYPGDICCWGRVCMISVGHCSSTHITR